MKAIVLLIICVFTTSTELVYGQSSACAELNNLVENSEANYPKLKILKEQCWNEFLTGANATFIKTLSTLNFSESLSWASKRRTNDHVRFGGSIKEIMAPYKDTHNLSLAEDAVFVATLTSLKAQRDSLIAIQPLNIDKYFDADTREKIQTLKNLPAYLLKVDALAILSDLDYQQENFETVSAPAIRELDEHLHEYINSSEKIVSNFQYKAKYNNGLKANQDFQQSISPATLKLKATAVWGKFLIKNNVEAILRSADLDIRAGLIQTATEKLTFINQLTTTFLSGLPIALSAKITELDSYQTMKSQNGLRLANIQAMTTPQIEGRQNEYLAYQASNLAQVRNACVGKFPSIKEKVLALEKDLLKLSNKENLSALDPSVRNFLKESIGNRLEIYRELCKEFVK